MIDALVERHELSGLYDRDESHPGHDCQRAEIGGPGAGGLAPKKGDAADEGRPDQQLEYVEINADDRKQDRELCGIETHRGVHTFRSTALTF